MRLADGERVVSAIAIKETGKNEDAASEESVQEASEETEAKE